MSEINKSVVYFHSSGQIVDNINQVSSLYHPRWVLNFLGGVMPGLLCKWLLIGVIDQSFQCDINGFCYSSFKPSLFSGQNVSWKECPPSFTCRWPAGSCTDELARSPLLCHVLVKHLFCFSSVQVCAFLAALNCIYSITLLMSWCFITNFSLWLVFH